jgi:hypothetical protein
LSSPSLKRYLVALFVAAFALNWPWEMAQMSAYVEMAGRPWGETLLTCTAATIGDALVTFAVYAAGALVTRNSRWALKGGWRVYLSATLAGALCAVVIEWAALYAGHWSYSGGMPEVLGVGVLPLIQLTLLVPAAFRVALWWYGRGERAGEVRDRD